jgi:hypothetical protein
MKDKVQKPHDSEEFDGPRGDYPKLPDPIGNTLNDPDPAIGPLYPGAL